ncbi:MAG: type II secretion system F family protein [Deltaproteobacteria bacterium]|jgi:type II secretory pathway component PulF|nr:type II secretion system F family protein [Deltaproteobacteria bacterium]MBT4269294.1 type II secretion system F family protein [Deltaproteobacteria bacterium]MBT4643268.1 type II secretion system F family protein [Deltaproteobacteria bacterium]MBT6498553.1 type II secretion system F family protein [Deltaproteobacteria bacterium]MBT6615515.1 type II secretion system F family protein [Deltaproteobacteria bacterium]
MALFEYRAIDKSGKKRKGKIDAPTLKQAAAKIKSQKLHLISISSAKEQLKGSLDRGLTKKRAGVPFDLITDFTRQLSVLVSTGIPYDKAFDILIEESEHSTFQHILDLIKARIVEGSSLASALEDHPTLFSKMYIAMVNAGEAGGMLDQVLQYLTTAREGTAEIKAKIQKALIYPLIMTLMGLGIVVFMVTFIIPKIIPIFQQFNVQLPLPTRMVIGLSEIITNNTWQLVLTLGIAIFFLMRFVKSRRGELIKDWTLLKTPVLGKIIKKIIVFRFTQTLGTLLQSGVELKQSLDIVKQVMGNRVYENQFDEIALNITKRGMDLSQALRQANIFPVTVIQMIRVGEESSQLEKMLNKVSAILENEVKQSLEKSIALLEPALILWMAATVGFIVLAVMLPMLKMNQLI